MKTFTVPDGEVESFISNSIEFWGHVQSGDSKSANKIAKRNESLTEKWAAAGVDKLLIEVLLDSNNAEVRFFAAAYLIKFGSEKARSILSLLASDPKGMIAPMARSIIDMHKKQ